MKRHCALFAYPDTGDSKILAECKKAAVRMPSWEGMKEFQRKSFLKNAPTL